MSTQTRGMERRTVGDIKQELLSTSQMRSPRNEKLIVWICGVLSARTIKFISALKKQNYKIVLLKCVTNDYAPLFINELEKLDLETIACECEEELMYYALQFNPLVYVFETQWADCTWAELMLRHKERFGKIVISIFDNITFSFTVSIITLPQNIPCFNVKSLNISGVTILKK